MEEKKDMRQAMIYLQKFGISTTLAAKIYQHYGRNVYRTIEENPYQLADHVPGVGFKTADEIAAKIGIHTDSDFRIRSGIFYTLQQSVIAWCSDSGYGTVPDGSCDGKKDCYEAVGAGNEDIYVSLLLYGIKYSKNAA